MVGLLHQHQSQGQSHRHIHLHRRVGVADYEATSAFYAPLPSPHACIAHQKLELQHRQQRSLLVDQFPTVALIPESHGRELHLGGFIIVIDTHEWKSEGPGPLFASFDGRPATLAVVEPG